MDLKENPKERHRRKAREWKIKNKERMEKHNWNYANSEHGYLMGLWHVLNRGNRQAKNPDYEYASPRLKSPTNLTRDLFFKLAYDYKEKMGGWLSGYSGKPMTMDRSLGISGPKREIHYDNVSIDRLDNEKPYTYENIIFCTWKENNEKGAMPIKLMRRVLEIIEERKNEAH